MRLRRRSQTPDDPRHALTALADGTLEPARRAELEARVEGSPELSAALAEQERAVALLRGAAAVEAPAGLRARIEAERQKKRTRPSRRPLVLAGGVAAAAAVAIALVLTLPSGAGGPSIAQATSLATLPATGAAPSVQAGEPKLLAASADGVPFPKWLETFGWEATGIRTDTIDGREATTVFYEKEGNRIGYTIVAGDPLEVPSDAGRARREGTDVRVFETGGAPVVTWLRGGHTCILSGAAVEPGVLVKLATWPGRGAVPF